MYEIIYVLLLTSARDNEVKRVNVRGAIREQLDSIIAAILGAKEIY